MREIHEDLLLALCLCARGHRTEEAMTTIQVFIDEELEKRRVAIAEAQARYDAIAEEARVEALEEAEKVRVKAEDESKPKPKSHVEHPLHLAPSGEELGTHELPPPAEPAPFPEDKPTELVYDPPPLTPPTPEPHAETMKDIIDRRRRERESEGGV